MPLKIAGLAELKINHEVFSQRIQASAKDVMEYMMTYCEGKAKHNAPWTDRTGNARNSITGTILEDDLKNGRVVGALYIGMDYGLYLELSNQGKYAIIGPTLIQERPMLLRTIKAHGVAI